MPLQIARAMARPIGLVGVLCGQMARADDDSEILAFPMSEPLLLSNDLFTARG